MSDMDKGLGPEGYAWLRRVESASDAQYPAQDPQLEAELVEAGRCIESLQGELADWHRGLYPIAQYLRFVEPGIDFRTKEGRQKFCSAIFDALQGVSP